MVQMGTPNRISKLKIVWLLPSPYSKTPEIDAVVVCIHIDNTQTWSADLVLHWRPQMMCSMVLSWRGGIQAKDPLSTCMELPTGLLNSALKCEPPIWLKDCDGSWLGSGGCACVKEGLMLALGWVPEWNTGWEWCSWLPDYWNPILEPICDECWCWKAGIDGSLGCGGKWWLQRHMWKESAAWILSGS